MNKSLPRRGERLKDFKERGAKCIVDQKVEKTC